MKSEGLHCLRQRDRPPYRLADNTEKEYTMQSLIENPDVFEKAIAQNKIMIVRMSDLHPPNTP
jgi:hypothetical protein